MTSEHEEAKALTLNTQMDENGTDLASSSLSVARYQDDYYCLITERKPLKCDNRRLVAYALLFGDKINAKGQAQRYKLEFRMPEASQLEPTDGKTGRIYDAAVTYNKILFERAMSEPVKCRKYGKVQTY